MQYQIKRGAATVLTVTPTGSQRRQAMGVDVVNMSFSLPNMVNLNIGDTVEVYGRTYKLNRPANITKISSKQYDYTLEFEALFYDLAKVQLRGLDVDNNFTQAEFTIMAKAADIVDLIIQNANRLYSGYTVGVVDETELQNFIFNGENCLQALNRLADAFQSEFWIDNKTIHFQKREQSTGLTLSYGQGNGLYQLYRGKKNDADVVTRLYVEGGSRNLPEAYGKTRLQLPGLTNYLEVEDADEIIEATQVFDNIIPERVGTITALGADKFKFIDSSMDFDVNDHLSGKAARIGFQTGALAGYEFELASYNAVSKEFKINLKTDEKAYPDGLPNDTLKPAVGDKYVVFDIYLPNSYVVDAQTRLQAAGQAYLDKYKNVQYEYKANLTPIWVKQNSPNLTLGYTIQLEDAAMGIDKEIRIVGYTRNLQEPNTYDLELGDTITIAEIVRQYAQQERILYAIQTAGLLDPEQMRKNLFLNRLSENDGYLIIGTDKVKAGHSDTSNHALTANEALYAEEANHALNADFALYAQDSDKWDGRQFADYLNQPVRTIDSPMYEGVSSPLFVSGSTGTGFRVAKEPNGDYLLELDRLVVRKDFSVYELTVNKIRATNGSIWVTDAIKIIEVTVIGSNYLCAVDTANDTINVPFIVNDVLRCQVFNGQTVKYYAARVLSVTGGSFTITRIDGSGLPASGDELVRVGNTTDATRQGSMYLTASDSGAPYLDVLDGVDSSSFAGKTKVRLGKLNGIVDPDFGALSGYGIYAERGFFKGTIQVTGGNAATKSYADGQALNAQNTAISAAATDATNKVNAVQIGGRNLLKGSSNGNGWIGVFEGNNTFSQTQSSPGELNHIYSDYFELEGNTEYTLRFLSKNTSNVSSRDLYILSDTYNVNNAIFGYSFPLSTDWTLVVCKFTTPPQFAGVTDVKLRVDHNGVNDGQSGTIWIKDVMLAKGNKATDWTPAPEDVQEEIEAVRTETTTQFNVLQTEINAKVSQATFNALNERVGTAETTLVQQAGQISLKAEQSTVSALSSTVAGKADQSTVNGIESRLSSAELKITPEAINLTVSSQVDSKIVTAVADRPTEAQIKAGISITPGAINIFGQELSLAGKVTFSSLDAGAQNQINVIAQDKVNALQVGGRNLLKGSSNGNGWIGVFEGNNTFSQTQSSPGELNHIYSDYFELEGNTEYTLRFLSKNTSNVSSRDLYILSDTYNVNNAIFDYSFPLSTDWTLVVWKFTTPPQFAGVTDVKLRVDHNGVNDGQSGTIWIKDVMLAKGNKATDWTPAPEDEANARIALANSLKAMAFEDVVEASKLGNTVIQGGYLATNLIDANYIKSNIVNAAYIQTIDLTANKITAGRLQSVGGGSYFDLDNNQFKIGSGDNSLDWNVTNANQLTIKGHIEAETGLLGGWRIGSGNIRASVGDFNTSSQQITLDSTNLRISLNYGYWTGSGYNHYNSILSPVDGLSLKIRTGAEKSGIAAALHVDSQFGNAINVISGASNLKGLSLGYSVVSGSYTCSGNDYYILCVAASTIYLPSNPVTGRTITVFKNNGAGVTVSGNGYNIHYRNDGGASTRTLEWSMTFVFLGDRWQLANYFV